LSSLKSFMMVFKSRFLSSALILISSISHASTSENIQPIQQRTPPVIIDFSTFPYCAQSHLLNFWTGCDASTFTGLCDPVACPSGSTASSNSTNDLECITTDCFCKQSAPIQCGWECGWGSWYNFEDWFSTTCPDALTVDFSNLPSCVRQCLPDQYIIYGCITLSSSCLCITPETFGCATACDTASNKTINSWFTDMCGPDVGAVADVPGSEDDGAAASTTTASSPTPSRSGVVQRVHPKAPIHWYEIWAIVIVCLTVLALVTGWLMYKIVWWKSHQFHPVPSKSDDDIKKF
jgi:hypothetical protein